MLVHAAGSGVGTAAIQLIKGIPGTQVIATAGMSYVSSSKFDDLSYSYDLSIEHESQHEFYENPAEVM